MPKGVVCDKCAHEFKIESKTTVMQHNGHEVNVTIFNCPECNQLYVADCITKQLKQKITKLKKIFRQEVRVKKATRKAELQLQRKQLTREAIKEGLALRNEIMVVLGVGKRE